MEIRKIRPKSNSNAFFGGFPKMYMFITLYSERKDSSTVQRDRVYSDFPLGRFSDLNC